MTGEYRSVPRSAVIALCESMGLDAGQIVRIEAVEDEVFVTLVVRIVEDDSAATRAGG